MKEVGKKILGGLKEMVEAAFTSGLYHLSKDLARGDLQCSARSFQYGLGLNNAGLGLVLEDVAFSPYCPGLNNAGLGLILEGDVLNQADHIVLNSRNLAQSCAPFIMAAEAIGNSELQRAYQQVRESASELVVAVGAKITDLERIFSIRQKLVQSIGTVLDLSENL